MQLLGFTLPILVPTVLVIQSINPINPHKRFMKVSTDIIPTLHMGNQRAEKLKCYENSEQRADNSARAWGTSVGKVSYMMSQ